MKIYLQKQSYLCKWQRIAAAHLIIALALSGSAAVAEEAVPVSGEVTAVSHRKGIKGTVRDASGQPMPGVGVMIVGTKSGTSTDANGNFNISVPTGNETLIFTSIGYKAVEVVLNGRTEINVRMEENASDLNEVVVVGYGTQEKKHLTGAIATVNVAVIADVPVGTLSAALRGQLPGVSIAGGYSRPGEPAKITIRNPSFAVKDGGRTEPLYVIDDIFRTSEDFNLIDASEVESISILKDAAAAIYGIQGANGVVVVRTKRGKAGVPKISYGVSVGASDATQLPKMMSGIEQATYLNDYTRAARNYVATGSSGYLADAAWYTPDELEYFRNNSTDWLPEAWQTAMTTRHTLNVSGGSDKATYFAGASYITQGSNFDGVNTDKWTFRASSDIKLTKGLNLGLSLSGDLSNNKRFWFKQGSESLDNDVRSLIGTPMFNPYYVNGLPVLLTTGNTGSVDGTHFFEVQKLNNYTNARTNGFNVQATLNYDVPFITGLKAGLNFSKNLDNAFNKQYGTRYNVYQLSMLGDNKHIYGGDVIKTISVNNGDKVRISSSYKDSYQLNGTLNYSRKFGKHSFSVLGVYEQVESETDLVNAAREGVIMGGLDNQQYATGVNLSDESQSEFGRLAWAGRLNYSFADKYLVEFSYRGDASVYFAPGNRWGYFPSLSLGWVMSEEPFFKKSMKFVDYFKLRASVGLLGIDNTRNFGYARNYSLLTGKAPVFGGNSDRPLAISPNIALANENMKWDNNTKINVGFDAQFLKSRLVVGVDGFLDHNYNQLTTRTSSVSLLIGAPIPAENYGITNSFGYELSLTWKDKIGSDWGYNLNTFLQWNDNKNIRMDQPLGFAGTFLDGVGHSSDMGVLGYKSLGIIRTQEHLDELIARGYKAFGESPKLGMIEYQDLRGPRDANGNFTAPDGIISENVDYTFLTPKSSNHYNVGFNLGGTYKTFSLNMVIGLSWGGQESVESAAVKRATATSNRPAFWADHWTPENPNAEYPNPFYTNNYDRKTDFWFRSSTTFRMSNINLSYGLPTKWAERAGLANAKIFFVGTNPINFYNPYDYKDNTGAYDVYPNLRTFSLGLNVSL
ncbi:SusC/RagA family TonB-linked outer membrane protein [Pedobacter sp. AW31-3R]|uniref:SusC/RagA family TonB-linked outer membrane protein n=1 Tax=Pedobacter sp. AW31-3R TaxID=3445781 RepID=UPI003FA0C262